MEIAADLSSPTSCQACGAAESMRFGHPILSSTTGGEGAEMYVCTECGTGRTVYTKALSISYGDEYYSYNPESYSSLKTRIKGVLYKYASFIPVSIRHRWLTVAPSKRPGKVLDIGCGCGNSLDVWKMVGWQTFGSEISETPVEICKTRGHNVELSFEPWSEFANEKFDWITLDNVLEHIDAPEQFLVSLKGILAKDGIVTICVPNYGGKPAEIFGPYWDALLPDQHLTHFTREGLEALLARSGLKVHALSFQPRFHVSLGHVTRYGTAEEATRVATDIASWKKSATRRLLSGRRVSEDDGYFLTIDATLAA